jgi:putative transposase
MNGRSWIGIHPYVTQKRQCVLASVVRATVYVQRKPKAARDSEVMLKRLIDEEYTRHPFYGSRKMVVYLQRCGHRVNRKRAQRLMRSMGLAAMVPGPNTSWAHPQHKVYPHLLRGVPVVRVNQVWSTDITHIRLASGFAYLVAIIEWYSRRVSSWRISNTMEAAFYVDCLEDALCEHGNPEVFNSGRARSSQARPSRRCSSASGHTRRWEIKRRIRCTPVRPVAGRWFWTSTGPSQNPRDSPLRFAQRRLRSGKSG